MTKMSSSVCPNDLVPLGISSADANRLAEQINALPAIPPELQWPLVCRDVLHSDLPAAVHAWVHRFVFRDWPAERGPAPAWFPSPEVISNTNIAKLLNEFGLPSYAALYEWSITERAKFWDAMIRTLGI